MNKRIETVRILNNCLMIFVVFVTFMSGIGMPVGSASFLSGAALVLFVLFSELIQAFISNLVLFLVSHIAAGAVVELLLRMVYKATDLKVAIAGVLIANISMVIAAVFLIAVTVAAIYTRLDEKGRFYPEIFEAILFVVLFIYCKITKSYSAELVVLICEMIWGVLAVLYYNTRQTIGALLTFHEKDFVPYEQIRKNNGIMLGISLAVSVVAMLICTLLDYGKELVAVIKSAVIAFLTWFFSHFQFEVPEETYEAPEAARNSGGMGELFPKDYVDDSFWHKLWDILFLVVAAAVTILMVYLLVKLVKEFYKLFNSSKNGIRERLSRDKKEFLNPLKDENEKTMSLRKDNKLTFRERLNKRGRVRYLFSKYIVSGNGFADARESFSPSELEKASLGKEPLAYRIYEKARYSSLDITSEDVDEIKSLMK